jgi:predicted nucleic acid-binding protein
LANHGVEGQRARDRLNGEALAAPELIDIETASVFRGLVRARKLSSRRAIEALSDLADLPLERASHHRLISRCWELRDNLTPYDATYVALAELLSVRLVTADERMAHAPRIRCTVEVLR